MKISNEDQLLLTGLSEGNERIYDYIFLHYYSGLVAYAIKIGLEKEIAEDIVQDFFLKLWDERNRIKIKGTLKSYFFTSIKNKCLDQFRAQKSKDKYTENIKYLSFDSTVASNDFLVESELRERIHKAIDCLPPKCKEVFIMNRIQGMKPAEIADLEGVSIRTVEGHIGKALRILRKELKPYLPASLIALLLA